MDDDTCTKTACFRLPPGLPHSDQSDTQNKTMKTPAQACADENQRSRSSRRAYQSSMCQPNLRSIRHRMCTHVAKEVRDISVRRR
eukprot:3647120-Prymnesium_polylepis.1